MSQGRTRESLRRAAGSEGRSGALTVARNDGRPAESAAAGELEQEGSARRGESSSQAHGREDRSSGRRLSSRNGQGRAGRRIRVRESEVR
jgi:hypothetical protein